MSTDRNPGVNDRPGLDLKSLPALEPPHEVLPEILAAVRRGPASTRGWLGWATAALLVVSIGTIALLAQRVDDQAHELTAWIAYSQQLESQLRVVGGRNPVVRGHRAAALGELEQRVALIDLELSQRPRPAEEIDLWRQRAVLLHDLVTVHASDRLLAGAAARRPVVTINPPLDAIPASYEF